LRQPGVQGDPAANLLKKIKQGLEIRRKSIFRFLRIYSLPSSYNLREIIQSKTIKNMTEGRTPVNADGKLDIGSRPVDIPTGQIRKLMNAVFGHINSAMNDSVMGRTTASTKASVMDTITKLGNTQLGRSAQIALKNPAVKASLKSLKYVVDVMDAFDLPLTIADAFLNAKFPNESDFLAPAMVRDVKWQAMKSQIDFITKYNTDIVDSYNANSANATAGDFPRERAQFPIIMGPLDKLDSDVQIAQFIGSEYRNAKAKVIVLSAAEQMLRTIGNSHRNEFYNNVADPIWRQDLSGWQESMNDEEKNEQSSLTRFFFSPLYFTPLQRDNLFRDAFTVACNHYGGKVYEDVHITDETSWNGRPRFQCGFRTRVDCIAHSRDWIENAGVTGGDYAEWYTYTDINDTLQLIPDSSSDIKACNKIGKNYASNCSPTFNNNTTGACITTNPYMSIICSKFEGVYDHNLHMCTYTQEFCQSMGMCYDRVNKVCQLPHKNMFAFGMFFGGDGVTREWIKINGCGVDGDTFSPENIAVTTGQYMFDMFRDKEGIKDGMKNSFSPTSINGAIGFTILLGAAAGFVWGPLTLVAMAAVGIEIGVAAMQSNQEENQRPPDPTDYPKEYAITGLSRDGSEAIMRGYAEGWLTKPIRAHTLTNWPPASLVSASSVVFNKCTDVRDIPTSTQIEFFSRTSDLTALLPINNWGATGRIMSDAISTYTSIKGRTKNYCYDQGKLRSGSNAIQNDTFCIDYKPPIQYADLNIGALASEGPKVLDGQGVQDESFIVNRAWTDASAPDVPQYPSGSGRNGASWGNRPDQWYYQLVYDRDNMRMDRVTKMPVKLWDTDYLSIYFSYTTIEQMRVYYCNNALVHGTETIQDDAEREAAQTARAAQVDDRCWGYLNIKIPDYKYYPMTLAI
jgi:hypothetical protein